jgi:hypothetical protein
MAELGIAFQTDKRAGRYGVLAAAAEDYGFDVVSVFADLLYQPPLPRCTRWPGRRLASGSARPA